MESFHWDACFVTGLEEVDQQHHRLVDLINQFGELLVRQQGVSAAEIEQLFGELAAYAEYHFREEEGLMARSQLDPRHIARHKEEHSSFLREVVRMREGMTGGNREAAESLLKFLIHWLAYHILGSDQTMSRQIAAIQSGESPGKAYLADRKERDPATATLLASLNGLFHEVSERNRALYELNRTLEARVAERTRELSEANQRLEELAMTDVLTGLPNRRHGLRSLENAWKDSLRASAPLSCMMIDADGFKTINDTCGHDAGDDVLKRLSRCLSDTVRTDDLVCRLGGDEFLIVCSNTPLQGALNLAELLRSEVAKLHVPAGNSHWVGSISVGVASRTPAIRSIEELMKTADEGVYLAKRNGRNCVATVCGGA